MTDTEELHRLLDERGVEWEQVEGEVDRVTEWNTKGGYAQFYGSKTSSDDFLLVVHYHLTPEQVVATTLGPFNDSCNCTNGERTNDELLPCPFCGGEAKAYQHGEVGFVVQCRRCGIWNAGYDPAWSHVTEDEFHGFVTETDAIAAWNRRADA